MHVQEQILRQRIEAKSDKLLRDYAYVKLQEFAELFPFARKVSRHNR